MTFLHQLEHNKDGATHTRPSGFTEVGDADEEHQLFQEFMCITQVKSMKTFRLGPVKMEGKPWGQQERP